MCILLTNQNDKSIINSDKYNCQKDDEDCHMEVLNDTAESAERTQSRAEC